MDATLPYGLAPLVVPQLKTITLGGAVTGMGVESTSFRNGLPHESVLEMDVLTGTGEIVTASAEHNVDLFRGLPWIAKHPILVKLHGIAFDNSAIDELGMEEKD